MTAQEQFKAWFLTAYNREPEAVEVAEKISFVAGLSIGRQQTLPDLQPVIDWLEKGCDPKEAAKELRIYQSICRLNDVVGVAK